MSVTRRYIIGIDEVGRGPLAGPITVAAVAAPASTGRGLHPKLRMFLKNIKDSKKLSAKRREEWLEKITAHPRLCAVAASVGPSVIDRFGISRAATIAVGRCLKKLSCDSSRVNYHSRILLDGSLYAPRTYSNQETIVKGDERVPIIAAASIVAKVTRDNKMVRWHRYYPQYGFAKHKGYGTRVHQVALCRYGLTALHRRTFCHALVGNTTKA